MSWRVDPTTGERIFYLAFKDSWERGLPPGWSWLPHEQHGETTLYSARHVNGRVVGPYADISRVSLDAASERQPEQLPPALHGRPSEVRAAPIETTSFAHAQMGQIERSSKRQPRTPAERASQDADPQLSMF